eukprot:502595-Prorocentrum_minimum.AAC.2
MAAMDNAVCVLSPSKFTGAPASSSATSSFRLPARAASASGGSPSMVCAVTGAPLPGRKGASESGRTTQNLKGRLRI